MTNVFVGSPPNVTIHWFGFLGEGSFPVLRALLARAGCYGERPFRRSVGSLSLIYLLSVERLAPVFLCACWPQVGVCQVELAELNLRRGMCLSVQEGPGDLRVQCSFCGFLRPPFLAPGSTPLLSLSAVLWAGSLLLILDRLPMLSSLLHLPSQVCVSNVSWVEFLSFLFLSSVDLW